MQVLVDARDKLDIPWEHPTTQIISNQAAMFQNGASLDTELFVQYAPTIHKLWQDRGIKKAYDRRREFQIVSFVFDVQAFWSPNDDSEFYKSSLCLPFKDDSNSLSLNHQNRY